MAALALTLNGRPQAVATVKSRLSRGRDVADGLATSGVVCFHDGASLSFNGTVRAGLRLGRAGVGLTPNPEASSNPNP